MKNEARAAVFVPHLGCPNNCVFCNQHAIAGVTLPATANDVHTAAKYVREYGAKNAEIAFFGGSFTAIEHDYMRELLDAAEQELAKGSFSGIRLSTRPDCINDEILEELKAAGVTVIELGAQSMVDDVLLASGRGHTSDDTRRASEMIKKHGIELGLQMMTGLPGDNDEGAIYTAQELVKLAPQCVRIYPTIILKNTELENMYLRGEYIPQTLDQAINLCVKLCDIFDDAGITVIRLGLQRTETQQEDMVAGGWHPAFGELVYGERYYIRLRNYFLSNRPEKYKLYTVACDKGNVSAIVGQKRKNFNRLNKEFGIRLKTDTTCKLPELTVTYIG